VAQPILLPNGIGGTTGHSLATGSPLQSFGATWYVGPGGTDAVGPAGWRREAPLATLSQAYTNASAGDTIVFLAGHAETLSSSQVLAKIGLTLVSEGDGSNRARFTCNAAIAMLDVTAAAVRILNVYFPASTTAAPTARVRIGAAGVLVEDCYFECGALDTNQALQCVTGAASVEINSTTFISTAATPATGLKVSNGLTGLVMRDVVFDGGSFGWTSYACHLLAGNVAGLYANGISLLNNSDVDASNTGTGVFLIEASSGSAIFASA